MRTMMTITNIINTLIKHSGLLTNSAMAMSKEEFDILVSGHQHVYDIVLNNKTYAKDLFYRKKHANKRESPIRYSAAMQAMLQDKLLGNFPEVMITTYIPTPIEIVTLYYNKYNWILCPEPKTDESKENVELIRELGMHPILANMKDPL